ncbi:MAG TPA: FHA domain-containing protein [Acidimicrobiales bacterium]|nr:FHA domain-containing protein [Acidimicrobiales bacterium]
MSDIVCGKCGHRNPTGANYCSSCGSVLGVPSDEATGTLQLDAIADLAEEFGLDRSEFPAGLGILVVRRGPIAGSRFVLDADCTTAGRHPDSDIFLDDITVSRRHAELRREGPGRYVVRDAGSLNGTYVNRSRVDQIVLVDGDELQIGMFKLVFFHGTKR